MIAEARFYEDIADELVRGAVAELEKAGATWERIAVPGALELPAVIKYAICSLDLRTPAKRFDAYVALGCVIRGETSHYEHVCTECARGLQSLAIEHALALGFGVLTVENRAQALVRASPSGHNKGAEAVRACLAMLELKRTFHLLPG